MNNKNYRIVDGYEVHPLDIVEKLISLAEYDTTTDNAEEIRQQLTDALYYLDTICENRHNNDYHRTLYNTLAIIADNTAF